MNPGAAVAVASGFVKLKHLGHRGEWAGKLGKAGQAWGSIQRRESFCTILMRYIYCIGK